MCLLVRPWPFQRTSMAAEPVGVQCLYTCTRGGMFLYQRKRIEDVVQNRNNSSIWLSLPGKMLELNAPARGGRGLNCPLPPACIPLPCTLNDLAKGGKGAVVLLFPACIRLPYVQQNAADAPTGRSTRVGPPPCYDIGIRLSLIHI